MIEESQYYYYTPEGEKQGPYARKDLAELQAAGKIPGSASVMTVHNGNWHLLVDVLSGDHPYPMSRRRNLGKCPRCHCEVHSMTEATYGHCENCRFPLGTPRRVAGIRRHFMYTLKRRYFCFRGRAVRAEYWSFFGACSFIALVGFVFFFAYLLLSCDDFNQHLINNRGIIQLIKGDTGDIPLVHTVFMSIGALAALVCIIPFCGLTVRRLHDIGYSGWWFLLNFALTGLYFATMASMWGQQPEGSIWLQLQGIMLNVPVALLLFVMNLVIYVLLPLKDSAVGPNKYGPSPKYPRF